MHGIISGTLIISFSWIFCLHCYHIFLTVIFVFTNYTNIVLLFFNHHFSFLGNFKTNYFKFEYFVYSEFQMHGITSGTFIKSFSWILFKLLPFEQMCKVPRNINSGKATQVITSVISQNWSIVLYPEYHYHQVNCVHLRNLSYRKTNQQKNLVINAKCMQK